MGAGNKVASWACKLRVAEGRANCNSHHVREDVLEQTYRAAIQQMSASAAEIIEVVREGVQIAMDPNNAATLKAVEDEIIELQEIALKIHKDKQSGMITDTAYTAEIRRCSERMQHLEAKQEELQTAATRYSEVKAWLDTFERAMTSGKAENTSDAALMKALVEQITVSDDGIEVAFKCGAKVTQKYVK